MNMQAPAVHVPRRSRHTVCDEARAVSAALRTARGIDEPLPVVFGGRVLGHVLGEANSNQVYWCGYTGIDDVISSMIRDGKFLNRWFHKAFTATAGALWSDFWCVGGYPQAGVFAGAAKTAVQFNNSVAGGIWVGGNVSPDTKHFFAATVLSHGANGPVMFLLYDRVIAYEACTLVNASQNMTNTLPAQRYISTGQSGMRMMVTVQTTLGGAANLTAVSYTDNAGTAGQAVPTGLTMSFDTTPTTPSTNLPAASCVIIATQNTLFLPLKSGTSGARSVESYTCSAAQTGTFTLALVRPIAYLPTPVDNVAAPYDMARQLVCLERLFDGCHLSFAVNIGGNTDMGMMGNLSLGWS